MASTSIPHLSPDDVLDWLSVEPGDRADCAHLLAGEPEPSVAGILTELARRLDAAPDAAPAGHDATPDAAPPGADADDEAGTGQANGHPGDELTWVEGYLRFAPTIIHWHLQRGIPEDISRATLADFGRNLAISRRVHGEFGLDTWPWLGSHFAGLIHQLGRLQYLLHRSPEAIPGATAGEWILGIHIPEAGSLDPEAVGRSLAAAGPFFARYFPDQPVRTANCESWLLDPYLGWHLDAQSNIVRFARLFTPYGEPVDKPSDAVYFTFRTRSMENLDTLPRRSSLQRTVLERIDAGGCWQLGYGSVQLP